MTTPMILDCDPGHDDALAIMLAAADPRTELLAITTVAGNTTLDKATLNARRVCTIAGVSGVPVAAGCDRPLTAPLRVAEDIHGASGLDGPAFGEPVVPLSGEHAVHLMRRLLLDYPEPVTLVPTGPLTNIATLLRDHPAVLPKIREIVLMGGSTWRGNTLPYGEFNIVVDPEAADLVFHSGLPITMIGLNVTHQALVTPQVVARFRALGTPLAEACVELMTFFAATYERVFGLPEPPLHDPIAVARVIDPTLVTTVAAPVAVELAGTHTRGATVVDLHARTGAPSNAQVALALDVPRFWDLLVGALTRLSGSPAVGSRG